MDFIRTVIPTPYRIAILLCVLLGIWLHGYWKGSSSNAAEIASLTAVGAAQDAQYRRMEKETQNALQTLVDRYRAVSVDRDRFWMRLNQTSSRSLPQVPAVVGSLATDPGHGLEAPWGACSGDVQGLRDDLLGALAVGEKLEATLALCQAELRACAGLR